MLLATTGKGKHFASIILVLGVAAPLTGQVVSNGNV
jgi:hypothetical protein